MNFCIPLERRQGQALILKVILQQDLTIFAEG